MRLAKEYGADETDVSPPDRKRVDILRELLVKSLLIVLLRMTSTVAVAWACALLADLHGPTKRVRVARTRPGRTTLRHQTTQTVSVLAGGRAPRQMGSSGLAAAEALSAHFNRRRTCGRTGENVGERGQAFASGENLATRADCQVRCRFRRSAPGGRRSVQLRLGRAADRRANLGKPSRP